MTINSITNAISIASYIVSFLFPPAVLVSIVIGTVFGVS